FHGPRLSTRRRQTVIDRPGESVARPARPRSRPVRTGTRRGVPPSGQAEDRKLSESVPFPRTGGRPGYEIRRCFANAVEQHASKRSPHPVSGGKRPGRDRVGSRPIPHPSPDDHGVPLLRRTAEPFFSHDGKPGAEGGSHRPSFDPRMVSSSGSEPHRPNGPP